MIFLNLGCGGVRPPHLNVPKYLQTETSPWINVDNLHAIFPNEGCPERLNMDAESNYVNCDIRNGLSFHDDYADGIVASHFLEHLDIQESISFLKECKRVLKPGGVLRISVPCAKKFHELSVKGAGPREWGESSPNKDISFMEHALFFNEHKQILTAYGIFCLLWHVGFSEYSEKQLGETSIAGLAALDNRPNFSVFVEGRK